MKRREGFTYRIYDARRFTLALDPTARGGVYSPEIHIYWRASGRRWSVKVPHVSWPFAYRHKRLGALRAYRLVQKVIYGAFKAPPRS